MWDATAIYAPANKKNNLWIAGVLIVLIAIVDWWTKAYISLGFMYLFPIMLVAGFLRRPQIIMLSLLCSALQEFFSNLPVGESIPRLIMVAVGYIGTGFFISELVLKRRLITQHVEDLEHQIHFRRDAEQQLEALIESSPAAIVTVDSEGCIERANQAAEQLLAPDGKKLRGESISSFLPALHGVAKTYSSRVFRTMLQCQGRRNNNEVFLAAVWLSTFATISGPRLAAIMVDLSEDVRDREQLSLDHLLKNARIVMGAVSHEIRNLCGAISMVHKNLSRVPGLPGHRDFMALGTLVEGLEKISSLDLKPSMEQMVTAVELSSVLDELRLLVEPGLHESGMRMVLRVADGLPAVSADRYGLMQVFLNLVKNSRRAMESSAQKQLTISAVAEEQDVLLRFEDTGHGVPAPEELFQPFQKHAVATGLGLYVSRAILRTFRGDLHYEGREIGCCFTVSLVPAAGAQSSNHASHGSQSQ